MAYERFDFIEIGDQKPRPVCEVRPTVKTPPVQEVELVEATPERQLVIDQVIGRRGTGTGEFNCPAGLACDSQGNLYVADSYNHRIQRIAPDGHVTAIGGKGSSPGRFLNPQDIAIGFDASLYILEQGNHRIQRVTLEGHLIDTIGRRGNQPGEFSSPMGLAVDERGGLYVADTGNRRVQKLGSNGLPVFCISGRQSTQMMSPQGIEVDTDGNCYVADTFSNTILKFDEHGHQVVKFGTFGRNQGQFDEPQDLALDEEGMLYVIEMSANRMQVFCGPDMCVGCIDGATASIGPLNAPTGIAIGPNQEIFVADTMNHRVLKIVWREMMN